MAKFKAYDYRHSERSEESSVFNYLDPSLMLRVTEKNGFEMACNHRGNNLKHAESANRSRFSSLLGFEHLLHHLGHLAEILFVGPAILRLSFGQSWV
jgi:hypothetical protein